MAEGRAETFEPVIFSMGKTRLIVGEPTWRLLELRSVETLVEQGMKSVEKGNLILEEALDNLSEAAQRVLVPVPYVGQTPIYPYTRDRCLKLANPKI